MAQNITEPRSRQVYHAHLRLIMGSLEHAARINPNEEHAFMTILAEVKAIYEGRPSAKPQEAEDLDFGEPLEAGIPGHGPLMPLR